MVSAAEWAHTVTAPQVILMAHFSSCAIVSALEGIPLIVAERGATCSTNDQGCVAGTQPSKRAVHRRKDGYVFKQYNPRATLAPSPVGRTAITRRKLDEVSARQVEEEVLA